MADRSACRELDVILEPAGACDDDVDALTQLLNLRLRADATEDGDRAQVHDGGQRRQRGVDLGDEFTRGGQDQRPRTASGARGLAFGQPGDQRQQERIGLAGAGAAAAEHVAARQ